MSIEYHTRVQETSTIIVHPESYGEVPALSAPIVDVLEDDGCAVGVDAAAIVVRFEPRRLARRRRIRTFTDSCIATGIGLHLLLIHEREERGDALRCFLSARGGEHSRRTSRFARRGSHARRTSRFAGFGGGRGCRGERERQGAKHFVRAVCQECE